MNLPLELRRLIWKRAAEPRVVRIDYLKYVMEANDTNKAIYTCSEMSPVLLRVNKDSREFALHHYQRAFHKLLPAPIYFDFKADTLFLSPANMMDGHVACLDHTLHFSETELKALRYIAFSDDLTIGLVDRWESYPTFKAFIEAFTSLEIIFVVFYFSFYHSRESSKRRDDVLYHANECTQLFAHFSTIETTSLRMIDEKTWSETASRNEDATNLTRLRTECATRTEAQYQSWNDRHRYQPKISKFQSK